MPAANSLRYHPGVTGVAAHGKTVMKEAAEVYPALLDSEFIKNYDFLGCHTRCDPDGAISEFDVAVALTATRGNLGATARLLGRSRRSIEGFVSRHPFLPTYLEDLESEFLDQVESVYKKMAEAGVDSAARFFLSTKGKDRGYVSRQEQTGKNGVPLAIEIVRRVVDPKADAA